MGDLRNEPGRPEERAGDVDSRASVSIEYRNMSTPELSAPMACEACGAFVTDTERHTEWHEKFAQDLRRARLGL